MSARGHQPVARLLQERYLNEDVRQDRLIAVPFQVKVARTLKTVPAEAWDACAFSGPARPEADSSQSFRLSRLSRALEESGCVGRQSGWNPAARPRRGRGAVRSLLLRPAISSRTRKANTCSTIPGPTPICAPADATIQNFKSRCRSRRLPALASSFGEDATADDARRHLVAGLRALRAEAGASSIHATFLPEADADVLAHHNFLLRNDQQFHWFNEDYASFDDFLAALASRKRKAIRRERRDALSPGITVEWAHRQGHLGSALGRILLLLHGHGIAQVGAALPQPSLLLAHRRDDERDASCSSLRSVRGATSPGL